MLGRQSEGVTRTQCEEFIERARSDARANRLSLPAGSKLALTFSAASVDYVARLNAGDGKNLVIKRRQLGMYLNPYFGPMRLDAISAFSIEKYKKHRLARRRGGRDHQSRTRHAVAFVFKGG